jgi:zona occludens toxin
VSIAAYTGLPGSGKSYGVVENVVIPALKSARHIVTNMPLERDKLLSFCGAGQITFVETNAEVAVIVQMGVDYPGVVFVLDECWRYWPAGKLPNQIPESEKEFFAMHRHRVGADGFSTEIVLVTQDLSQISGFVRALVEQTFRATKLTAVGSKNKYRVDVYEGAVTGPKPSPTRRLREMYGKYKPEIYALYRSHTQSMVAGAGDEVKADDRGSLLKGWRVKLSLSALALLPFLLWGASCSLLKFKDRVAGGPRAERSEGATAAPQPAPNVQPTAPVDRDSTAWRFAGSIVIDGQEWMLIDSIRGTQRIAPELCKRGPASEWVCRLGNEIVTRFTGPAPPSLPSGGLTQLAASALSP